MPLIRFISRMVVIATAFMMLAGAPVRAQEISQSHLDAALDAINSARAARGFDTVLPALAEKVQNQLIRLRPDLHKEIAAVVEAIALKLVARRADLDNDIARVWAKTFTEDELKVIAEFFKSPAGKKYAELGPRVIAESFQAVKGWSERVEAELLAKSREELKKQGFDF